MLCDIADSVIETRVDRGTDTGTVLQAVAHELDYAGDLRRPGTTKGRCLHG